ncbi:hypothetical protein ACQWHW_24500, partial [Salmonella enterica subsp. enterica serovar Infantis]
NLVSIAALLHCFSCFVFVVYGLLVVFVLLWLGVKCFVCAGLYSGKFFFVFSVVADDDMDGSGVGFNSYYWLVL